MLRQTAQGDVGPYSTKGCHEASTSVFVVGVPAGAPAFAQAKAETKPNPGKPLMAYGTVIAVTGDSSP
jgi:hypothetical protein